MGKTVSDLLFVNLYLISLSLAATGRMPAVLLLLLGPEVAEMIRCGVVTNAQSAPLLVGKKSHAKCVTIMKQ